MDKKEAQITTDNKRVPSGLSTFCDFRQIRKGLYIPYNMAYTTYLTGNQSEK